MKVIDTALPEVKIIELVRHGDQRGFFVERFHQERFADAGLPTAFVQDNHSRSAPGVLRGVHYQHEPAQGKLVGVTRGCIWDVAVDLRAGSPNFGKHVGVELSDENARLLWVPAGFGHGFCVLGEELADVLYKVTEPYNPAGEGGVCWDDDELAIDWPLEKPVISERDAALPTLVEYKQAPAMLWGG